MAVEAAAVHSFHLIRRICTYEHKAAVRACSPQRRVCHASRPFFFPPLPLLSVPHPRNLGMPHLLLKLEDTVHKRLTRRRTARHIDIHWHNSVTPSCHAVAVVVVSSTVRARAHGNDPTGIWHLIVDLSQCGCHLVGKCAGDDHDIGLTWRGTENYTKSILVVSWGGKVHHLDGAAGETEGHGPEGALSCPVGDRVQSRARTYQYPAIASSSCSNSLQRILYDTLVSFLTCQWHFHALCDLLHR